jgi:hypothetical protein
MPGVRYGPDISDDAAQIQNRIVELLKLEKASKSGKLTTKQDWLLSVLSLLATSYVKKK